MFLQNPPNPTLNCSVVNNDIMELSRMKVIRNWIRKKYEFDTNLFTNAQLNGNLYSGALATTHWRPLM